MPIIGTASLARHLFMEAEKGHVPEGFRSIGNGGTRTAYLHEPTNVVYKVCTWDYDEYNNRSEVSVAQRLWRRVRDNDGWWSEYVRIPKVSGFKIDRLYSSSSWEPYVCAMEYVAGRQLIDVRRSVPKQALESLHKLGFRDMHGYNVIVDADMVLWPIDMGSPRNSYSDGRALMGGV
jgi:hypothetical protein